MNVRPARPGEGQVLFDITAAAIRAQAGAFYSAAQLAGWMAGRDAETYEAVIARGAVQMAEADGEVLGFVDTVPGMITRLYVRPGAMGRNLGALLLARGVAAARLGHEGPVRLEATLQAVGFYARRGFVEVSRGLFADPPGRIPVEVVNMVFYPPD